ncbi:hypothetical protein DL96DRAFT_1702635 [Flagelloscypha sp. PMI_526]|nr:hypothetical protein DL96DRAFT_1702635 [Flagelloscypha sp. PMI_526]
MGLKALLYAYILGGLTFIPLVLAAIVAFTIYTSIPVGEPDPQKGRRGELEKTSVQEDGSEPESDSPAVRRELQDVPRARKGWLTVRRTFEESATESGYVNIMRSFLDARSKDPKRSKPKDMWYVALKGKVLYLYDDESMTECEAAIELSSYNVVVYPEGLPDAELFAKRNALCLKPKPPTSSLPMPNVSKDMKFDLGIANDDTQQGTPSHHDETLEKAKEEKESARENALNPSTPWFIFVRSNVEMEDWYLAFIHASDHPAQTPVLFPLRDIFRPGDMGHLVATLDEQPDVIPMRWFNGLLGRIFFSHYRTDSLENFIIGRLMKKLSKVKTPAFLTDIVVSDVSVGNRPPMFSKPMLKELTKEGDMAMEIHLSYKGEIRITVEATALIQLGTFKSYTVKLVLAAVLRELEGNLLIKVKRPPSNRLWYAFTQSPHMVLSVEPVVSDRQVTWNMILGTIESKLKEIIEESIVMPNMDDIAYFDSSPYDHRGGIWSDAVRKFKQPGFVHDSSSAFSEPALPPPPTIDVSPESDTEDSATSKSPPEPTVLQSSATIPLQSSSSQPHPSVTSRAPTRSRRFCLYAEVSFSSLRLQTLKLHNEQSLNLQVVGIHRLKVRRFSSIHEENSQSRRNQDDEGSEPSSSASSSLRSSALSKLSKESLRKPEPPSPTNFLTSLKARAADAQAINQAKDTMRKWGVNWSGLTKDSNNEGSSGSTLTARLGERLRTQSASVSPSKPAQTFAEIQAAVAQRRSHGSETPNSELVGRRSASSSPVPIPQTPTKARSASSSVSPTQPSLLSGFSPGPSTSPLQTSINGETPFAAVSAPAQRPAPPTAMQPQARTMSIPGIHASRRGEVMSMGNVAPERPPSPVNVAPAMQTLTRLWKTRSPGPDSLPARANQNQESFSPSSSPPSLRHSEHRRSSTASSSSAHGSPRLSTPSLANSTPTAVSRPPLEPPNLSSESLISSSETLKSIVTKDDEIRRASTELTATESPLTAT